MSQRDTTLKARVSVLAPKPGADKKPPDPVQEASEESFPASDPPAHGGSTKADDARVVEPKITAPPPEPKPPAQPRPDKVLEASKDSFPASDPPAWGTSHV